MAYCRCAELDLSFRLYALPPRNKWEEDNHPTPISGRSMCVRGRDRLLPRTG